MYKALLAIVFVFFACNSITGQPQMLHSLKRMISAGDSDRLIQQQRIAELETEKLLTATDAVLKGEEKEQTRWQKNSMMG